LWVLETGSGTFEDETDPQSEVSDLSVGDNLFSWKVSNGVCPDAMDQVTITVRELFTPTVITPNNDGENDFLVFQGIEFQEGSMLLIYNRWGTEVYRNRDYKNDWDGKDKKGRDLIPDTYYYILELPSSKVIKSFVEIRR
jgi:gliding motility-associated-like protein